MTIQDINKYILLAHGFHAADVSNVYMYERENVNGFKRIIATVAPSNDDVHLFAYIAQSFEPGELEHTYTHQNTNSDDMPNALSLLGCKCLDKSHMVIAP